METTKKFKKGMLIAMMALVCTTASAQFRHYGRLHYHGGYYRPYVTTIVTRPMTTTHISMAEAELDAFVASKKNPIRVVFNGKKKLYVLA